MRLLCRFSSPLAFPFPFPLVVLALTGLFAVPSGSRANATRRFPRPNSGSTTEAEVDASALACGLKVALLRACAAAVVRSARVRAACQGNGKHVRKVDELEPNRHTFRARCSSSSTPLSPVSASTCIVSSSVLSKSEPKISSSSMGNSISTTSGTGKGVGRTLLDKEIFIVLDVFGQIFEPELGECSLHPAIK